MTTAFALSGGGNLGPLQAGAMLALLEAGIVPDLLVGSSVGALNAAAVACRPDVEGVRELVAAWGALRRRDVVRPGLAGALAGFVGARNHLLSPARLHRLIERWVPVTRIEETTARLAVTATDALSGAGVVLTEGPVVEALAASAAIPGLFPAIRMGERWLIDGSLSANRPARQAQALGADVVYVITTATAPRLAPPRGAIAMAMNSVSLVTSELARIEHEAAVAHAEQSGGRIIAVPSAEPVAPGTFEYRRGAELADAAYRRTVQWLAERQAYEGRQADIVGSP